MKARISIIVVAYNIENFIEQCLVSCVFADAEYEVIVVHNASIDRTLDAIYRVTNKYPDIFTVIDNKKNEGLGEGRNIGMDHATGEYVLFLDGDDWFRNGALKRVMSILDRRRPDVLMYNYVRIWDTGGMTENPNEHLLWERDISEPAKRASIIPSMGVAWNRAYRRDFLVRTGLRFNRRYYEDIDWNFSVILRAKTYYVIPDRLIYYRQRNGSITKKVDPRHMEMLDQYRDVYSMYLSNPDDFKPYARAVYKYAKGQLFNVVSSEARLPKELSRSFLVQSAALLKEWRASLGFSKIDIQILAAGTGFASLFKGMASFRRTVRGIELPKLKDRVQLWIYRNIFVRLPLQEKKAVFESYWGRRIDCNPDAIASGLAKTGKFNVVWGVDKPSEHHWPHKHILCERGSLRYLYHLATAKYLISNVNFAGTTVKRQGSTHVQTFHGTPIKAMGLDIRPVRPKEMNWRSFAVKCRKWDIGISSNPYSTAIWRRSHPYNYRIIETGYPRNDALASSSIDRNSVRAQLGVPNGKKVILYAPTFRDDDKGKPIAVSKSVLDFERMQSAMGSKYVLMVRAHHLSVMPSLPDGCIDASGHKSINEILSVADVLITDYSSLMFDYATQRKPIVVYGFDFEKYAKKRGFYFDIRNEAPGAVVSTLNDLLICLRTEAFLSSENFSKLDAFRSKYCMWDDGNATARVLKQVFDVE